MALFNYATKEITLKIVYYGPGLSGKTTNLQYLHSVLNPQTKGKLLSLSTEADRTLFFDFLPIELGKIKDFSIRFQLYTVPGQVRYNATRKVVLKGADGVVFVADSQREMKEQNIESFINMRENLYSNNINPDEIPVVLQYNKRDLKNICSLEELNVDLNSKKYPVLEASAILGNGVEDSFKLITKLLLKYISNKHKIEIQPTSGKEEIKQAELVPEVAEINQTKSSFRAVHAETMDIGTELSIAVSEKTGVIPEVSGLSSQWLDLAEEIDIPQPIEGTTIDSEKSELPVSLNETVEDLLDVLPEEEPVGKTIDYIMTTEITDERIVSSETQQVPVIHSEKTIDLEDKIDQINRRLDELTEAVSSLNIEIRKRNNETAASLQDLMSILNELKTKKSWFKM